MTNQEVHSKVNKDFNYQAWNIVIIEDDEGLGKLIQVTLQREGFSTVLVETGEDALSAVKGDSNEILLVDYKLPDTTGKDLVEQLTIKYGAKPHFITLTGYGNEQIAVEMMKLGSHDYIVKDKNFLPLLSKVVKHMCDDIVNEQKLQVVRDQLEKNLELLRETGEMARVGGWEIDINTQQPVWSETTKKIHEVPADYSPTLEEAFDFFPESSQIKLHKAVEQAISKGTPYDLELEFVTAKGNHRWVHTIGKTEMKNGKCIRVHGTFQDITKRKETEVNLKAANQQLAASEQQLRASNQQLAASEQQLRATNQQLKANEQELIAAKEKAEESDRLKSAFLTNMSHEIRTPMNGILGFTNLLQNPNLTGEQQKEFIDIIQKSGNRMLNTVNDLIEISRIETGEAQVNRDKINICLELKSLCNFFQPEAEQKGLQFIFENPFPNGAPILQTDKTKFTSITTNLIKNAIKYTNEGAVEIGCKKRDEYFLCYIKDTGIGIPENRQQAIFNRFEQADIEDTRAFEGSGLGLAIAKSYVEMLGGEIWVESQEGVGSTFLFSLPWKTDEQKNKANGNSEKEIPPVKAGVKPKILIAEDDEASFQHLLYLLENYAREIIYAENGVQAVELCKQQKDIDIILMDIKMPVLDGYEATRQIRDFYKDVVIIAQTAYALSGDREKILDAGCDDYITKPINNKVLLHKIGKLKLN